MKTFIICLSILMAAPVFAGKLYKIVDENGNVSFSQFPPQAKTEEEQQKQSSKNVEEVGSVGTGAKTRITMLGSDKLCGDITLPSKTSSYDKKYYASTVVRQLKSWERSLDQLETSVVRNADRSYSDQLKYDKYRTSSYRTDSSVYQHERSERDSARIKDLRCAIAWAESQESETSDVMEAREQETKRLQKIVNELELTMESNCGSEPPYDPTSEYNAADRKQWQECYRIYEKDIRTARHKLRNQ